MALRSLASTVLPRFGYRLQPLAVEFSQRLERTFASQVEAGCKYAESHEWVNVEGDTAKVGITDYAQQSLGDVVFVELPKVGTTYAKGEQFGVVESVKAASDIYAPVSGTVVEVNSELDGAPDNINGEPYGNGWIAKLKLTNPAETDDLMDAAAYSKLVSSKDE